MIIVLNFYVIKVSRDKIERKFKVKIQVNCGEETAATIIQTN